MRRMWTMAAVSAVALGAAVAATADTAPLRVVATVGMLGDVAAEVAGDCAQVETLLAPGVDPHYYSATPSDVRRLSEAELVLYVDAALEEQLARVLDSFGARVPVLGVLAETFTPEELRADPDAPGALDPHAWMDARLWARTAAPIAAAIGAARPDCAAAMADRAAAYAGQLDALHGWVAAAVATIPEERRVLVTAHDAFEYYAAAYGLEVAAIEGLSTVSEASIADIRETADVVVAAGVPAVFVESTISPRTIEALVQEVRARGGEVGIGGLLYSDSLGGTGTPEGTYIGMLRANTATIVAALGGTVPPLPAALAGWAAGWGLDG